MLGRLIMARCMPVLPSVQSVRLILGGGDFTAIPSNVTPSTGTPPAVFLRTIVFPPQAIHNAFSPFTGFISIGTHINILYLR